MAERIRNSDWKDDKILRDELERYVLQNRCRQESLDFVKRDYPQYVCIDE
jgi:hypothetical protein